MSCNCNKPKCDGKCGISPSVLQINNPGDCTLFHRIEVPASMGDSKTNPPKNGDYRNVLLYYVADGTSWLFSSDGVPQKLVNGFTNYEDAINLPQINGETLIGNKSGAELGLQDKLIAGDNIQIAADGKTISATDTTYGPATDDIIGLVKPGDGLSVEEDGTLNVNDPAPEDFFRGDATDSGCGATVELENMIVGRPRSFEFYGNNQQIGTPNPSTQAVVKTVTGYNLVRITDSQGVEHDYEINLGKNLFDKNAITPNSYIDQYGSIGSNANFGLSDYISVFSNTTYAYSGTHMLASYAAKAAWYDKNQVWMGYSDLANSGTLTSPTGAAYVRLSIRTASGDADTTQLELGPSITEYAEYFEPIELRGISAYKDYIYRKDGKWYKHKVIEKTSMGTLSFSNYNNAVIYVSNVSSTLGIVNDGAQTLALMSNVFMASTDTSVTWRFFYTPSDDHLVTYGDSTYLNQTGAQAKQWMLDNSVIMYYALANPIDEEITNQALIDQLNNIELSLGGNLIQLMSSGILGELCVSGYRNDWAGGMQKLDDAASEIENIESNLLQRKVDYYHITTESSQDDIISAFASTKAKVIEFDKGSYDITAPLFITSNTTVYMNGATLKYSGSSVGIFFYPLDSIATVYNGVHDVAIMEGEIIASIAMMHNSNITFKNINFPGPNGGHVVEVGGCKDVYFDGCTFGPQTIADAQADQMEIIQLETATQLGQPYLIDPSSVSYDHTGNKNIFIERCVFQSGDGTNTKLYTAIGHHSFDAASARMNDNIVIRECTFGDAWSSQIRPCGLSNSIIDRCDFNQVQVFDGAWNIRLSYKTENVTITNNHLIGAQRAISTGNISDVTCTSLTIEGNTFDSTASNSEASIVLSNYDNVVIRDNIFGRAGDRNIFVGSESSHIVTGVHIYNNTFDSANIANSSGQTIFIGWSDNVTVQNNVFKVGTSGPYAIYVNSSRSSNLHISKNEIIGSQARVVGGASDYSDIYDVYRSLYSGTATYTSLTDTTPTVDITKFNTIILILQKNNDASYMKSVFLTPFDPSGKIGARAYYTDFIDDGGGKTAVFSVTASGGISYSSPDSVVLRTVYGINR